MAKKKTAKRASPKKLPNQRAGESFYASPSFQRALGQRGYARTGLRLRVAGNFIRDAQTGEILARYLNHFWHVGEKCFTYYECPEKPYMHFEDMENGRTPRYGPFVGLSVSDGSVHVNDKLVAKFIDPTILWHDIQSDTYWPNMILSDG